MAAKKTFFGIQILRGVAAVLVLAFHVSLGLRAGYGLDRPTGASFIHLPVLFLGNGGVDLFFLISGFVIVWTTQHSWQRSHAWRGFLEKRGTRIFPLYWLLTTVKVALVLAAPHLFKASVLQPWNTLASYLLIPSQDAEGNIQPVITAGWTLCYEMFFYYVCTVCLALKRRPVIAITPVFIVLGLIGIVRAPSWGALSTLIDPLLLEFVAGMWIADAARRGAVKGSVGLMLGLIVAGCAGLVASQLLSVHSQYSHRVIVWGIPAAAILYGTIALESRVDFKKWRFALLIGDASYSIYLTSVLMLQPVVTRARYLHLPVAGEWAVLIVIVAIGLACGLCVWWAVEGKLIRGLLHLSKPMREAWVNPARTVV